MFDHFSVLDAVRSGAALTTRERCWERHAERGARRRVEDKPDPLVGRERNRRERREPGEAGSAHRVPRVRGLVRHSPDELPLQYHHLVSPGTQAATVAPLVHRVDADARQRVARRFDQRCSPLRDPIRQPRSFSVLVLHSSAILTRSSPNYEQLYSTYVCVQYSIRRSGREELVV